MSCTVVLPFFIQFMSLGHMAYCHFDPCLNHFVHHHSMETQNTEYFTQLIPAVWLQYFPLCSFCNDHKHRSFCSLSLHTRLVG
ncbi:hypothetical protein B0O80DRAFT_246605 [Mortierella sp. GBAus27b]|nr:hypothetical protein B0O80DRAFT_246605 [Mortierella sp. GBAus27b]